MGVTFDAMETFEQNSDSIDKLTNLVSKMNMKMDKRETQYKLQIYQGRNRGQNRNRQDNFQSRNRSFNRDRNQSYNRGRGNYIGIMVEEITTDQMIGMTITGQMIGGTIIDKTIEGTITEIDQIMEGKSTEI